MKDSLHRPMPDTNAWPAYNLAWNDNTSGPADVSHLLHRPAGRYGFVKVIDGHLAFADGRRFRIWGQHLCNSGPLPPKHLAPVIARRMAKFGINCVRMHAIDLHWPEGILMRDTECSRSLDPEGLERLDWMIACLKEQGIYVDLNLHVARTFSAADGVKQAESVGWGKPEIYFDQQLILLQKEYARELLHHRNPFTNLRYADEPAVALIEITNENSLTERWRNGDLKDGFTGMKSNWGAVHAVYTGDLNRRWNDWLVNKYSGREAMLAAWAGDAKPDEDPVSGTVCRLNPEDFAGANAKRFHDEALFYSDIERAFFQEMRSYLRDELGAPQLILGNSDHNYSWSSLPVVAANTLLDITDSHFYWQHPDNGTVKNTPMADEPDRSVIAHLSRGAVEGYPHICTEINEPCPNDYAAEFIPVVAAYARLQDWDGIFFYEYLTWKGSYSKAESWSEQKQRTWFDMANNPVKMAQTAFGALMFLRGDAQCAHQTVKREMTLSWLLESIRQAGDREHPYWLPYLPGRTALTHRVRIAELNGSRISPSEGEVIVSQNDIISDTGELVWQTSPDNGRVLIDTPRHQVIIGRAGENATSNCIFRLTTQFAALQLASTDDLPVALTGRLLLAVCARVANTGQTWADDSRTKPADWGHAPVRIEPVEGSVILRGLSAARSVTIYPLDGNGQPGDSIRLAETGEGFFFCIKDCIPTPWYLVQVER